MKSGTDIIPEEFFDPTKKGDVLKWLMDFPIGGREKVDLLVSWAHAVGATINSSQYQQVYNSGVEGTPAEAT